MSGSCKKVTMPSSLLSQSSVGGSALCLCTTQPSHGGCGNGLKECSLKGIKARNIKLKRASVVTGLVGTAWVPGAAYNVGLSLLPPDPHMSRIAPPTKPLSGRTPPSTPPADSVHQECTACTGSPCVCVCKCVCGHYRVVFFQDRSSC